MTTGTITQTLPVITQSATANKVDYISQALSIVTQSASVYQLYNAQLVSIATAQEVTYETTSFLHTEVATATDSFTAGENDTLISIINASATPTYSVDISLHESVNAIDSLASIETTLLAASAIAKDKVINAFGPTLISAINVASTFELIRPIALHESASISETIVPGANYNQIETSAVNIYDNLVPGRTYLVSNTVSCIDTLTPQSLFLNVTASTASMGDTPTVWKTAREELSNAAMGSSSYAFDGSVYNNLLISTASMHDWTWAKDFDSVAWVLNTQSAGITSYSNYGFTSLAFHDGVLYATSPEGLFALNADNDAGRNIDISYKTGFLDFRTATKKHISDIYIGYTGGDIECDVETYDKEVYTYEMEYRDSNTPRNSRLKIGRGLSSRYWRFGFRNVNGADFQIQDIAVKLGVSKRRL